MPSRKAPRSRRILRYFPRGTDNGAAAGADIFDTAVLAGLAASLYGRGFLAAVVGGVVTSSRVRRLAVMSAIPGCAASHAAVSSVRALTDQP